MNILWEDAWSILLAGLALSAVLLVLLVQTGRAVLLAIMLGVLSITGALLLVEWWVVTPTEQIRDVLYDAAEGVHRNDVNRVLQHIAPDAASLRREVHNRLSRAEILEARITSRPKVQFDQRGIAHEATARFFARVRARDTRSSLPMRQYVGQFTVHLARDRGRWLIRSYKLGTLEGG